MRKILFLGLLSVICFGMEIRPDKATARVVPKIITPPKTTPFAIARVQTANSFNGNSMSWSVSYSATGTNNLLVVSVFLLSTNPITSVTDDGGNTYTTIGNITPNGTYRLAQYCAFQSSSSTSVTVNLTLSAVDIIVDEFSGFTGTPSTANCLDTYSSNSAAADPGPIKSSNISPYNNNCLIFSTGVIDQGDYLTAGSGFTLSGAGSAYGTPYMRTQYKISSNSSEDGQWTSSVTGTWGCIVSSFKQQGSSPGGFPSAGGKAIRSAGYLPKP